MENKKEKEIVITDENDPDAEIILLDDVEVITPENDPEGVTLVKDERISRVTSVGDKVIGMGKNIIKSDPKAKKEGNRSWFDLK